MEIIIWSCGFFFAFLVQWSNICCTYGLIYSVVRFRSSDRLKSKLLENKTGGKDSPLGSSRSSPIKNLFVRTVAKGANAIPLHDQNLTLPSSCPVKRMSRPFSTFEASSERLPPVMGQSRVETFPLRSFFPASAMRSKVP